MNEFYIFDIPVYLQKRETYYKARDKVVEDHLQHCYEDHGIARESQPDSVVRMKGHVEHVFGGPWDYNQIVGWIRLFAQGSGIGAHLWWTQAKRLDRRMKRTMYLTTGSDILPTYFPAPTDSKTVFEGTLEAIQQLGTDRPLKGRHIDLRVFRRVGPFIDWVGVMKLASERDPYSSLPE